MVILILLLLVIDQGSKIYVKTHMVLGERIRVTDWFYILFTENPGMAFGWQLFDKIFLTLFRIIASAGIMWILVRTTRRSYPMGFLICIALIFAGAVGNIFDSIFYGVIFDHSYGQIATPFPPSGGYAGWMHGKVVDMLYFPIIRSTYPAWIPSVGGEPFIFFSPIFNLADACISVGVIALLIFYPHSFGHILNSDEASRTEPNNAGQANG
ncbi:MAG: lipoprotein signal peptidase [Porphyromonas sp.]|nr:lipoprotein signal peptidase [Porphyromonas sp.]